MWFYSVSKATCTESVIWGTNHKSTAQHNTAVTPLLTHWSYCSLALSHWITIQFSRIVYGYQHMHSVSVYHVYLIINWLQQSADGEFSIVPAVYDDIMRGVGIFMCILQALRMAKYIWWVFNTSHNIWWYCHTRPTIVTNALPSDHHRLQSRDGGNIWKINMHNYEAICCLIQ